MKKEYKTWYERVFDGLIEMNSKPKEMEDGRPVTSGEGGSYVYNGCSMSILQEQFYQNNNK